MFSLSETWTRSSMPIEFPWSTVVPSFISCVTLIFNGAFSDRTLCCRTKLLHHSPEKFNNCCEGMGNAKSLTCEPRWRYRFPSHCTCHRDIWADIEEQVKAGDTENDHRAVLCLGRVANEAKPTKASVLSCMIYEEEVRSPNK